MNGIKKTAFSLLLVIPVAYSGAVSAGSIVIAKENGAICVVPLPELPNTKADYNLRWSGTPCDGFNDNVRTITFREVPSATIVRLWDVAPGLRHPTPCRRDDDSEGSDTFYVQLKTIKKQTSTKNIELDHLNAYKPGQIIEPGLQMLTIDAQSHLRDRLSCVQIEISEAPPSTSTP